MAHKVLGYIATACMIIIAIICAYQEEMSIEERINLYGKYWISIAILMVLIVVIPSMKRLLLLVAIVYTIIVAISLLFIPSIFEYITYIGVMISKVWLYALVCLTLGSIATARAFTRDPEKV